MVSVMYVAHSYNAKTGDISQTYTCHSTCPVCCPFRGHGCYGECGHVSIHWKHTDVPVSDLVRVMTEKGHTKILRHNVAGDMCKVGMKKEQDYHKAMYGTSKGIADSYGLGFMQAIKSEMEKQAKALVLVTPKEVDDKVHELFPYARVTHTNVACNKHAYNNGVNDGRNAMRMPAIN